MGLNDAEKTQNMFQAYSVNFNIGWYNMPPAMGVKDPHSMPGLKIEASRRNEVSVGKFELTRKDSE